MGNGLRVDFDADENPIGIEITAPDAVSIVDINRVLDGLGVAPMPDEDWTPLRAA